MEAAVKPVVERGLAGLIFGFKPGAVQIFVVRLAQGNVVFLGLDHPGVIHSFIGGAFHPLHHNPQQTHGQGVDGNLQEYMQMKL